MEGKGDEEVKEGSGGQDAGEDPGDVTTSGTQEVGDGGNMARVES